MAPMLRALVAALLMALSALPAEAAVAARGAAWTRSQIKRVARLRASAAAPSPLAAATHALGSATFVATYLEINCWLISLGGLTVLVDPILEGPLDFGLPPAVYSASKRVLPRRGLVRALPALDAILISQGLDDHAHDATLGALAAAGCTAPIVAPPSARAALEKHFQPSQVRYLSPGDARVLRGAGGGELRIRATSGALVGPPWQARENGYVLRDESSDFSAYYEPHVEFDAAELRALAPVDVAITPISGQGLPAFELVHGPADAARLVQTLRPRWVLPMANGDIDATGVAAAIVQSVGSPGEFERLLDEAGVGAQVVAVSPGKPLRLE